MNDGKRKRYRIADAEIEIAFTENYTEIICRDYEVKAEGKPDFVIEVTDEEVRQCRQATAQTCLYMREHYSLQRQRSYSDSEEEIRKNNSDAEGIRTI